MKKLMIGLTGILCAMAVVLCGAPTAYSASVPARATAAVVSASAELEGAEASPSPADQLIGVLREELQKKYPKSKIDLGAEPKWLRGGLPAEITDVRVQAENGRGEVQFTAGSSIGTITYSAWTPAYTALRRIQPGEKLAPEQFVVQEINLSSGQPFLYRGVILSEGTDLAGLETRQTILEGQSLQSTSVQRVPDIRRGEAVRIELVSGGLTLTTQGVAQEPSYLNQSVHVMSGRSKRELVGQLRAGGVVEVKL
jgi:flagella basal body P-ring formation protein FlgA